MPIRNIVTIAVAAIVSSLCYEKATHNRYATLITHAMEIVETNYVEEVKPRELFENAMTGMVGNLDEYSSYIGPSRLQLFQQSLDQEFVGIGVVVEGPPLTDRLTVISPVYDSPAYHADMRAGDVILEIDGKPSEHSKLEDAVARIKGPRGTTVTLRVQHAGEDKPVTIVVRRDLIHTLSVLGDTRAEEGDWNYYLEEDPRIGYVRLTTFGERTVDELREVLPFNSHPIKALILDLRGNAGGLLIAAVATCDMFIDKGAIVSIRGRRGKDQETFTASAEKTIFDANTPIVVMVDHFSASASEIVAACLKDHGRAVVVGQRSWGKGTVQNVILLEGGRSALKLTTASYWRPSGKNIHRRRDAEEKDDWGVRPTKGFKVTLTDEQYRKMMEQRHDRDILHTDDEPGDNGKAPPTVDDPPLKRAVEYLRSRIEPRLDKDAPALKQEPVATTEKQSN